MSDINLTTTKNTPVSITLNPGTYSINTSLSPSHGTRSYNSGTRLLTYTPSNNYVGTDQFGMTKTEFFSPSNFNVYITIADPPPVIIQGIPTSLQLYKNDVRTVSVGATGAQAYTWFINGVSVQGPSSANSLLIDNNNHPPGQYTLRVDVSNEGGTIQSVGYFTTQADFAERPLNLPLAVVDPAGGIASGVGGGVLVATGGVGGVGQWNSTGAPTVSLVDPSDATLTVASMVSTYNALMWTLGQSHALQTEPRLWFGPTGNQGLITTNPGSTLIIVDPNNPSQYITLEPAPRAYIPYGISGPQTTISISDVISGLNATFSSYLSDKIRFSYTDGRISLSMSEGSVKFSNPDTTLSFGSGQRMLARIFNDPLGGGIVMNQIYTGQLLVQGQPFPGASILGGNYPIPASVSITTPVSATTTSLTVSWSQSATPGVVRYYVVLYNAASVYIRTEVVAAGSGGPYSCVLSGLTAATTYKVKVVSSTAFEISQGDQLVSAVTTSIPVLTTFYGFKNPSTASYTIYWKPITSQYQLEVFFYTGSGGPRGPISVPGNYNAGSNNYGAMLIDPTSYGPITQFKGRFVGAAGIGPETFGTLYTAPQPPPT